MKTFIKHLAFALPMGLIGVPALILLVLRTNVELDLVSNIKYSRFRLLIVSLLLTVLPAKANEWVYYRFTGKLGDKVPVELCLEKFSSGEDDTVAGYIYYPQSKQPTPILIVGFVDNENWFYMKEFLPDGTVTGTIRMRISGGKSSSVPIIAEGEWESPKTGARFSLTTLTSPYNMEKTKMFLPKWYNSPLQYESPDQIGHEYSYNLWRDKEETGKNGIAEFTAAGKNKIHFNIINVVNYNIAEGESDKGRPAVLKGSSFTYTKVNDCDYAFKATFFKKFVVLKTLPESSGLGCFGMGASFDGVYIKIKQ